MPIDDGFHTMDELYDYRMVYNALIFNQWAREGKYHVHKSYRHSDGEVCFGGGWFVVYAITPFGQISNHYPSKYWDYFNIPARDLAEPFDGHSSEEALKRLKKVVKYDVLISQDKHFL